MVEKVILFNSPANSGKDFAVEYLSKQYRVFPFSFKQKLIEITKDIYSLTDEDIAFFSSREQKELRQHKLIGRSWRQALIHRSEEHTSELQSRENLVCRLLLEKKKQK